MRRNLKIVSIALVAAGTAGCAAPSGATPYSVTIDPADFVSAIDNPFLPLTPGMKWVYEGVSADGQERIEVSVTRETRQVMGITCVVVHDVVTIDGEVVEDTFDWYAQDLEGNVWYFGEDTREYENGVVVSTQGSWEAGVDGALPGIVMDADPRPGEAYRQEYYAGEAEDMAEVISLSETASVPYGSFDNVLMTRDWTPLEPVIAEQKYYASGVGLVLEVVVEGGSGRVELIEFTTE